MRGGDYMPAGVPERHVAGVIASALVWLPTARPDVHSLAPQAAGVRAMPSRALGSVKITGRFS